MRFLIVAKYVGMDQPVRLVETLEESQEIAEALYDDHALLLANYPESILEVDAPDYMGIDVLTVDGSTWHYRQGGRAVDARPTP